MSLDPALRRPHVVWLAARMLAWRLALPGLRRALPVATLARLAWPRRRSRTRRPEREALVARVVTRLYRASSSRADDNCLERCVLAYRFLAQAGAEPRLACGVRRADGELVGHAWIVVDGRPLAHPDEGIDAFTLVAAFGRDGAPVQIA
jgi:Transglutaminase-like superfamily